MSPSSDCHNDVKVSSLCDVQPSLVPADYHDLTTADCPSTSAPTTLLNLTTDTEADTPNATVPAVSSNSNEAVSSFSPVVTRPVDADCDLMSENTGRVNVEDSDADKNPANTHIDTALSHDDCDVLSACETQVPHVSNVDMAMSPTSADTVTVDS